MAQLKKLAELSTRRVRSGMAKPRLAIVSTFDDDCGIAGYTRHLVRQIEADFEVEVFDLNQWFMRSGDWKVALAADKMVKDFCRRAPTFDFVNIQLEQGTIGSTTKDILRRLKWIVQAAPALSVTFHTIASPRRFDHRQFTKALSQLRIADAWKTIGEHREANALSAGIYSLLRRTSRQKTVNVIVHTRRDAQMLRYAQQLPSVLDHPLVFLGKDEAARLRATTHKTSFPLLENLPDGAKTIGVFGFISEYKGLDTAVRALRFLPDDHHLLIFGAVHPGEIREHQKINHYIRHLLDIAGADSSIADVGAANLHLNVPLPAGREREAIAHPHNTAHRIHFLGPQTDEDFARAMCLCDAVVMPYLEVGQASSGAISIALDVGARIIAARNHAFLRFARYYPNCIEWFDVGNHVELAGRILARPAYPAESRIRNYGVESNREIYRAANTLVK